MSEETFRARALYEFAGQDETELNFQPNDILNITSTNAGEGWWFASNASGQTGAVPAAYLEKILPTVDDLISEIPVAPAPVDSQEPNEPPPAPSELYIEVVDPTPVTNDLSEIQTTTEVFPSANPFSETSQPSFQYNFTPPPPPVVTNVVDDSYTVQSFYPQQTAPPPPPMTFNDSTYDTPVPMFNNPSADLRTFELPPLTSSSSIAPVTTPAPVAPLPTPTENLLSPASPQATPKDKKSGFFGTLGRKSKLDDKKSRRKTTDVNVESAVAPAAPNSDSDSFSDSGNQSVNSPSKANEKQVVAKARFFDKHGLDNYILNGSKLKFDDHAEISYDESQGGVYWVASSTIPPFSCKIEEPHKGTKLGGFKAFMEYRIITTFAGNRVVNRRYKHFDWLHEQLMSKYRFICIPQLPGKQIAGRFEQEFVEERRRQLELWLNRICHHPVLCASFPVQHFVKCELTDKNNKEWKLGKRKVEKEESRDAIWLHCVNLTQNHPSELQIMTSIETFAQQQPALETHLRNLSFGLSKFLEHHTEIYEKDMQRIGELFAKLYSAVEVDVITPGNQQIATSMAKISASYNVIAQLYKTKASDGIRYFNEHLQEYVGLLACFPSIFQIYRSAAEFIRTVQQRGPTATPDYNGAIQRNNILYHVILAEINLFQKDKVHDLHSYMKTVLSEQIQFYEKVTDELREALATFH